MDPIKLRVPGHEAGGLHDDLTVWASTSGIDPGLSLFDEAGREAKPGLPALYLVHVSGSFFDQFPQWRAYIEQ